MYSILFLVRIGDQRQHREVTADSLEVAQMIARKLAESPRMMDISLWHGADRLTF